MPSGRLKFRTFEFRDRSSQANCEVPVPLSTDRSPTRLACCARSKGRRQASLVSVYPMPGGRSVGRSVGTRGFYNPSCASPLPLYVIWRFFGDILRCWIRFPGGAAPGQRGEGAHGEQPGRRCDNLCKIASGYTAVDLFFWARRGRPLLTLAYLF